MNSRAGPIGGTTMTTCSSGHSFDDNFSFCPHCGAPASAAGSATHIRQAQGSDPEAEPPSGAEDAPDHSGPRPGGSSFEAVDAGVLRTRFTGNPRVLAVVAVVVAALVGGGLWLSVGHGKHTITGDLALIDSEGFDNSGLGCAGTGGYDDISAGTTVTVSDGSGHVVGIGELGLGKEKSLLGECEFAFTVKDVPDEDFYDVEVSHRGGLKFSRQEMEDNDWYVAGSLGDDSSF